MAVVMVKFSFVAVVMCGSVVLATHICYHFTFFSLFLGKAKSVRLWLILTSSKIYPLLYESKDKLIEKSNFLICKSCHWCATCLTKFILPNTCPLCGNIPIESMPVSAHESYRLFYDYVHGLILEFWFDSNDGVLVN